MDTQQAVIIAVVVLVLYMVSKGKFCGGSEGYSQKVQSAQDRSFNTGYARGNVVPFFVNTNLVGRGTFGVPPRTLQSTHPQAVNYNQEGAILAV